MDLVDSIVTEVSSFAFTRETMFLENHPQMPNTAQARGVKDSFRVSHGKNLELKVFSAKNIFLEMRGQRTHLFQGKDLLTEYSYGHVVCREETECTSIFGQDNPKLLSYSGIVFTSHTETYNIHHFILEVLPVLWIQREFLRGKSLVIMGSSDSRFAQEIVDLLDLDLKVLIVPIGSICRFVDSYFLDTIPFRVYPTKILSEIRNYVWAKLSIRNSNTKRNIGSGILFLGRGDKSRNRRELVNEPELLKHLERNFGTVKVIRPGLMHINETIKLIGEAQLVAGPTGGALSNIIWARNIFKFIEVVPDTYPGDTESLELSKLFSFAYDSINSRSTDGSRNFASSNQEAVIP